MICFLYHTCNMQTRWTHTQHEFDGLRSFDYSTNRILHNLTRRLNLYCVLVHAVCGFPPEYCEFGSSITRCKTWLEQTHPDVYPEYYSEGTTVPSRQATHECVVSTIGRSRLHTHFARWCATHDHRQTHWPLRLGHSPWRPKKNWRKRQRKRRPKLRLKLMLM